MLPNRYIWRNNVIQTPNPSAHPQFQDKISGHKNRLQMEELVSHREVVGTNLQNTKTFLE